MLIPENDSQKCMKYEHLENKKQMKEKINTSKFQQGNTHLH